ncbi:hypothetical protein ACP4OV_025130 [Aristida adscensionis]
MDILVSAAVSELISRSASFLLKKCWRRQPGAEKNLQRLSRLLLRAHAIVEEAEGRRITNQAMLQQLKMLAEAFYRVGKSTLLENVCRDDMVRDRFSLILHIRERCITDGGVTDLTKSGVVKHENSHAPERRLLIVIELAGDIDDETWAKLIHSTDCTARATRIIITSRSDKIARLARTTVALRLDHLPPEAYWYFFKTLAFGTLNPDEHPAMASMAMEIATEQRQCFMSGYVIAELLQDNLDARFWRAVLQCVRAYKQKHLLLFEEHPINLLRDDRPAYYWRLGRDSSRSSRFFLIRGHYETESRPEEAAEVIVRDVLLGRDTPRGRFEALGLRSRLPPYYNYMITCAMQEPERMVSRCRRKRRIPDNLL